MKYAILTFGCRVNQADSFDIEESLRARGGVAAPADDADLVVVNTCTVTGAADQGARNLIRRVARAQRRRRGSSSPAATRRGSPAPWRRCRGVVPPRARTARRTQFCRDASGIRGGDERRCGSRLEPGAMGRTAYPLRVQTGCDERCAFCVIPSTRGASRSRPIDDVLRRRRPARPRPGYKELWLVGVHLGSYGRDLPPLVVARSICCARSTARPAT